MRLTLVLLTLLAYWPGRAQDLAQPPGTALSFSRSVSVPLNAAQLFNAASEAYTWTFGKEPGAKMLLTDKAKGTLKGTARMNFRSAMLTGREETMGTVSYVVLAQVSAGECRLTVTELVHTGNKNISRGGIHLKQLVRNDDQVYPAGGMGRSNLIRVHRELREASTAHITGLLQAFEARLRASLDR